MARESPLVAIGTQCRQRPGECTRRATGATRYRRLAARAEPSGGFAGGAPSVAGFCGSGPPEADGFKRRKRERPTATHHTIRLPAFFFFNDTATTEIYTLSLHDALPISSCGDRHPVPPEAGRMHETCDRGDPLSPSCGESRTERRICGRCAVSGGF